MARTSKSRGAKSFTMRSGNKSTFKMMGSSSPVRNDKVKRQTYSKAIDSVTADMTNEQLRDIVVKQHGGKASKWNVSYNQLIKKRRSLQPKETATSSVKPDTKSTDTKSTETTSSSDQLEGFVIHDDDRKSIFEKFGCGVLTGDALKARTKALENAAKNYGGM